MYPIEYRFKRIWKSLYNHYKLQWWTKELQKKYCHSKPCQIVWQKKSVIGAADLPPKHISTHKFTVYQHVRRETSWMCDDIECCHRDNLQPGTDRRCIESQTKGYEVCRASSCVTSSSSWQLISWLLAAGVSECVGWMIGQWSWVKTFSKSLPREMKRIYFI